MARVAKTRIGRLIGKWKSKSLEIQTKDRSIKDDPLDLQIFGVTSESDLARQFYFAGGRIDFTRWKAKLESTRICKLYPANSFRQDLLELFRRVQCI